MVLIKSSFNERESFEKGTADEELLVAFASAK